MSGLSFVLLCCGCLTLVLLVHMALCVQVGLETVNASTEVRMPIEEVCDFVLWHSSADRGEGRMN